MTTERRFACAAVVALVLAGACATGNPGFRDGLSSRQVDSMPPDVQDAYRLFAARCSRCHTLARPLNSGITDPRHWRLYVSRMRRQSGSGISQNDAQTILVFLDYYAEQVREGKWSGGPLSEAGKLFTGSSTRAKGKGE